MAKALLVLCAPAFTAWFRLRRLARALLLCRPALVARWLTRRVDPVADAPSARSPCIPAPMVDPRAPRATTGRPVRPWCEEGQVGETVHESKLLYAVCQGLIPCSLTREVGLSRRHGVVYRHGPVAVDQFHDTDHAVPHST